MQYILAMSKVHFTSAKIAYVVILYMPDPKGI